ncbi:hypothetical protein SAMN06265222_12726 [Neorhodopirellula lusitana]|uniref:TRASH domain-containing protein n=1 Tax=Neorhodopirellula lusitana TaxID=445327 RepID=A0ABY1QTX2_9BACT|nr:hypothetical protein [Neorhodopirellula lusitana]SMP78778.1 hypothetical protein SAMN06265222_12726 [Neorhodopirellula lusitana]
MNTQALLIATAALLISVGCNRPAETTDSSTVSEQTLVKLQQADALDGQEDHVIGKCYVCSLGMDGKEELTVDTHGYEAHLCSSSCRDHFAASADEVIASTPIPQTQSPE